MEEELDATDSKLKVVSEFFPFDIPLHLTVSSVNLLLILATITISLRVDRKDMCRLYTLWLYCAHAPNELVQIVISICQLEGLVDATGNFYIEELNLIPMIGKTFHDISSHVYRILALFMVTMTYTSYKYPMAFSRLFGLKRRNKFFCIGFIVICVKSLLSSFSTLYPYIFIENEASAIVNMSAFYVFQVFSMAPIVLMIALYALSIKAIVHHVSKNSRCGRSTLIHRRQLLSTIVYATAPNILLLPIIAANVVVNMIAVIPNEQLYLYPRLTATAGQFSTVIRFCSYVRVTVITISTFIAFTPYRQALLSVLGGKWKKNAVSVFTVTASQGTSSSK